MDGESWQGWAQKPAAEGSPSMVLRASPVVRREEGTGRSVGGPGWEAEPSPSLDPKLSIWATDGRPHPAPRPPHWPHLISFAFVSPPVADSRPSPLDTPQPGVSNFPSDPLLIWGPHFSSRVSFVCPALEPNTGHLPLLCTCCSLCLSHSSPLEPVQDRPTKLAPSPLYTSQSSLSVPEGPS